MKLQRQTMRPDEYMKVSIISDHSIGAVCMVMLAALLQAGAWNIAFQEFTCEFFSIQFSIFAWTTIVVAQIGALVSGFWAWILYDEAISEYQREKRNSRLLP